jgi:hypothetical protein
LTKNREFFIVQPAKDGGLARINLDLNKRSRMGFLTETRRVLMQRVTKRFGIVVALTLMVALWGVYAPMEARGQIKQLTIGIGIDADTLNPQEQTTTLIQNMCALLFDTYLYQTPEGKLEPRLVTKYEVSPDGLTWTLHLWSDLYPHLAQWVRGRIEKDEDTLVA